MSTDNHTRFARVVLDDAVDKPLDYIIPEGMDITTGMRVLVPVRKTKRNATVIELPSSSPYASKAAAILECLSSTQSVDKTLQPLAEWMARYYATPLRRVLRLFVPQTIRKDLKPKKQFLVKSQIGRKALVDLAEKLTRVSGAQAKVLAVMLKKPKGILLTELLERSGVSKSPVESLIQKRVLAMEQVEIDRSPAEQFAYFPTDDKTLSDEQQYALESILKSRGSFTSFLLHGVTGSGKTEVYLQAIRAMRKAGHSVLMLVPEISLTTQTIERFKSRFDEPIGILHHRLSEGERTDVWKHIQEGRINIVIGARSSVFAPLQNLGLILVDEEHDGSYKQTDEMPCYHARDVAVMRAKVEQIPVVLGSATPSLESYKNALEGKYTLLPLRKRPKGARLPSVQLINMKTACEKAGGFTLFSEELIDGITSRIEQGEQTLLFLNKRGYHSCQTCTACEHVESCPHCDISLTFHRNDETLACHQCGFFLKPPPRNCSNCGKDTNIKMKGYGTEQIERAIHAILPDVRTLRMDADTTRHKGSHDMLFKQFRAGKADVLIGTQMIAKGLHFPSVTLVGVINADTSLAIPDYRSSENTFSLITQVAGRSGRGALPGEVLIQTRIPSNYALKSATTEDYETFYKEETAIRSLLSYPPYSQLAKLIITSEDHRAAETYANTLRLALTNALPDTFELYPVMPCGIARIKNRHRFKLIVKGVPITSFAALFPNILPPIPKEVRLLIDINPLSTY